jgi:hypothetical protein
MLIIFQIFSVLLILIIAVSLIYFSLKNGIGPTPTSSRVKNSIIKNIPPIENGRITVLGSGFGFLLFPIAKKFPHLKVVGIENSFFVFFISKTISWMYPNVEIKKNDFFKDNLGGNKLLVCYLYPGALEKLQSKFFLELDDKTWVVTHTFAFRGLKETNLYYANDLYKTPIYFYLFKRIDVL